MSQKELLWEMLGVIIHGIYILQYLATGSRIFQRKQFEGDWNVLKRERKFPELIFQSCLRQTLNDSLNASIYLNISVLHKIDAFSSSDCSFFKRDQYSGFISQDWASCNLLSKESFCLLPCFTYAQGHRCPQNKKTVGLIAQLSEG